MRVLRRTAVVLGLAAALLASSQPARASVGDVGHDISFPQCSGVGTTAPTTGVFGIVGVTNGLPFSANPCLKAQAEWAVATGQPALYTNTANPGPASGNWPSSGTGRCVDATSHTDDGCAYEYGRKAATDALSTATTALNGSGLDPRKVTWWLDVEGFRQDGQPGNSWEDDAYANAADVQGFVDALRAGGVPEVGVYATSYQWTDITGGYTRAKSSAYRAAWGFAGLFPIEDGPVWFAGVGAKTDAQVTCGTASFTGGQRLLAQYSDGSFDGDYRCADPDLVRPFASTTAPGALTQAMSFGAVWSGNDNAGGTGVMTYDVGTRRIASTGTTFSPWQYVSSLQRTTARSATISATGQGWTTCLIARSRDVAGNVSAWTASRCTTVPLDDRALSGSSGWTRATGSGWFLSTFSSTTRQYATLTRAGLVTSRLRLIAQRCSTCGKVGVYLGSTLLTTVNLYASTTGRAVIDLPRFSKRTTSVTLKVLTSGKPVKVDGLVSSQV